MYHRLIPVTGVVQIDGGRSRYLAEFVTVFVKYLIYTWSVASCCEYQG